MDTDVSEVEIGFHADTRPDGEHARRYNLPTTTEVAILMPNDPKKGDKRMVCCSFIQQEGQVPQLQYFDDMH